MKISSINDVEELDKLIDILSTNDRFLRRKENNHNQNSSALNHYRNFLNNNEKVEEKTIDKYLGRSDTVYRDVRMLVDGANWEAKGGDRYLSGFIKGFEVIPYAFLGGFKEDYIAQKEKEGVTGLYNKETLFSLNDKNEYIANYEESMSILENIFPKDKNIILICGAGGYAGETKKMLIQLGWDENKIYNMGGYWYYEGNNKVEVKYELDGKTYYNFAIVPYHNIDFSTLHKIK